MKHTFRIIALLLTLCLLAGTALTLGAYAEITSDKPAKIAAYNGAMGPRQITTDYGIRMAYGASFNGLRVTLVSWGQQDATATLSLYEWKGDYNSTVNNAPVATLRLDPVVDCHDQEFLFDEQAAGEYLFRISDVDGTVGVMQSDVKVSGAYCYDSGKESRADWWLTVYFTQTPDVPFGEIESAEAYIDGTHTPPAEWMPAEDHILHTHKVMPDTWVFTDGLGRESYTYEDVGGPKEDKTVAMFYWSWHLSGTNPFNITAFMEKYPEAKNDYDHPGWPTGAATYYWDEPIYGYYKTTDTWVLRRQAELLANAGVDTVFTDNTNGAFTWKEGYDAIYAAWDDAQTKGAVNVPKVSYTLPFYPFNESAEQIEALYRDVYRPGRYENLWFYWEGKPMLMGCNDHFVSATDNLRKEIGNFFTFRSTLISYTKTDEYKKVGQWGWLSIYPQTTFPGTRDNNKNKKVEQTTVGVAANYSYTGKGSAMNGEDITGRSYTDGYKDRYVKEGKTATLQGYFFSEQFDYALEQDPQVIFITGWNEWTAGRQQEWGGVLNAFADQFTEEFSRDIEPTRGDLQDHYYYLLVNYVRKYKGVNPIPTPGQNVTIDMGAGNDQWSTVEPYYAAYIGNTEDRDADGKGIHYTETSGRNDIIGARIARDDEFVWFYVECNENITPYTDSLWMNLYIDSDQENQGWNTFEFVVNKSAASADTLVLERFTAENDYSKTEKIADVEYKVEGKYMTVKIAKADLGILGDDYTVNFSWTDNVHDEGDYTKFSGDILEFYVSGDVAPGGRFKYSYVSTAENAGKAPQETETAEDQTQDTTSEADTTSVTTPDATAGGENTADSGASSGCGSVLLPAVVIAMAAALPALCKRRED